MTIAELIEYLCRTIGDMAVLIEEMADRLLQTGSISDDELKTIEDIQRRVKSFKIDRANNES